MVTPKIPLDLFGRGDKIEGCSGLPWPTRKLIDLNPKEVR
jgi:hypothetical protein